MTQILVILAMFQTPDIYMGVQYEDMFISHTVSGPEEVIITVKYGSNTIVHEITTEPDGYEKLATLLNNWMYVNPPSDLDYDPVSRKAFPRGEKHGLRNMYDVADWNKSGRTDLEDFAILSESYK